MTRQEKIFKLVEIYKKQRSWQRLVYGEELDMNKVNALTDEQLDNILEEVSK